MAARPFVLVHGAWHGGWCWQRVTPLLEAAGHRVLAPTFPGLGERAGELAPDIGLEAFIADVVAQIAASGLADIVLVGHSFAGCVISGVADRIAERLAHLVFLDATVVPSGGTAFDILTLEVQAARRAAARKSPGGLTMPAPAAATFGVVDPADAAWVEAHLTPMPIRAYEEALVLRHPLGNGVPKTYIACTKPEFAPTAPLRQSLPQDPGWTYLTIPTGHDAMVTAPRLLADMLLAVAAHPG